MFLFIMIPRQHGLNGSQSHQPAVRGNPILCTTESTPLYQPLRTLTCDPSRWIVVPVRVSAAATCLTASFASCLGSIAVLFFVLFVIVGLPQALTRG